MALWLPCVVGDLIVWEGRGVKEGGIYSSIKPGGSLLASQAVPVGISPSAKQHPSYPAHSGGAKIMRTIADICSGPCFPFSICFPCVSMSDGHCDNKARLRGFFLSVLLCNLKLRTVAKCRLRNTLQREFPAYLHPFSNNL